MTRLPACVVLLAALLLAPPPRDALAAPPRMKPAARRHLDKGMAHYQQRAFDKAIKELKKGQRIDPRPEFLYALGQVYRASGDCKEAIAHYEGFLETAPPPAQAEAARRNIERCKELLTPAAAPPPVPAPPPVAEPPPPSVVEPRLLVVKRPWYRDWTGHALVGGGVAVLVAGVVVWQMGRIAIDRAWAATTYDDYAARAKDLSAADAMQKSGIGLMAAGGALIVSGVLKYVLLRPTERRTSVALTVGPGSALLTAKGSF